MAARLDSGRGVENLGERSYPAYARPFMVFRSFFKVIW